MSIDIAKHVQRGILRNGIAVLFGAQPVVFVPLPKWPSGKDLAFGVVLGLIRTHSGA